MSKGPTYFRSSDVNMGRVRAAMARVGEELEVERQARIAARDAAAAAPRPAPEHAPRRPVEVVEQPEEDGVEKRPAVAYSVEGGGVVATCQGCGWCVWKGARLDVERAVRDDHKTCRADLVKLHARLAAARRPAYARRPESTRRRAS